MFNWDFFYFVAIDEPEVAFDILMPHRGYQTHILLYLIVIFRFRCTKLKVYHYPFLPVRHHTIRPMLLNLAILHR